MKKLELLGLVEQYCRKSYSPDGEIKIVSLPDRKTVYVEQTADDGRAIMLSEMQVDGKTYWAGYSDRSQTIYVSMA